MEIKTIIHHDLSEVIFVKKYQKILSRIFLKGNNFIKCKT